MNSINYEIQEKATVLNSSLDLVNRFIPFHNSYLFENNNKKSIESIWQEVI